MISYISNMILYHAIFFASFSPVLRIHPPQLGITHGTASLHSLTTWDMVSRASAARFLAELFVGNLMEFLGWRNIQHPKSEKNEMMISPGWYDMIWYYILLYICYYMWYPYIYIDIWFSPCLFQHPRNLKRKKNTNFFFFRAAEIQRVENGPQGDASWKPYYKSLVRRRRGLDGMKHWI